MKIIVVKRRTIIICSSLQSFVGFFLYLCLVVPLSSLNIFSTRNVSKMNGTMWELVRKYIRCSSRTTIGHIKKYLKLKLKLSAVDQVKQKKKSDD